MCLSLKAARRFTRSGAAESPGDAPAPCAASNRLEIIKKSLEISHSVHKSGRHSSALKYQQMILIPVWSGGTNSWSQTRKEKQQKRKTSNFLRKDCSAWSETINISWNHANWTDVGNINIKINRSIFVHNGSRN